MSIYDIVRKTARTIWSIVGPENIESYRREFEEDRKDQNLSRLEDGSYTDSDVQVQWIEWVEYSKWLSQQP